MMEKHKLTVVVPVYNVKDYLKECLCSISEQDLEDFQVFLIDDGSRDESAVICDKIALEDSRFIAIHTRNKGQSHARNCGIAISNSDYITFVDSDDAVLNGAFSTLLKIADETKADIVSEKIIAGKEKQIPELQVTVNIKRENRIDFVKHLFLEDISTSASLWNKIFKSVLFDELRFKEGISNEDFLLFYNMICKQEIDFIETDYIGYFHRRWDGSITASFGRGMMDAVRNAVYAKQNLPFDECRVIADSYLLRKIFLYLVNMPETYIRNRQSDYLEVFAQLKSMRRVICKCGLPTKIMFILYSFLIAPSCTKKIVKMYFRIVSK